jgi:hypothetical protein
MNVFDEMQRLRNVTLRVNGSGASIKLVDWPNHKLVRFHARLRNGETVEGMILRALCEMQRRTLEGMPQTPARVIEQRRLRKLLHSANSEPM